MELTLTPHERDRRDTWLKVLHARLHQHTDAGAPLAVADIVEDAKAVLVAFDAAFPAPSTPALKPASLPGAQTGMPLLGRGSHVRIVIPPEDGFALASYNGRSGRIVQPCFEPMAIGGGWQECWEIDLNAVSGGLSQYRVRVPKHFVTHEPKK